MRVRRGCSPWLLVAICRWSLRLLSRKPWPPFSPRSDLTRSPPPLHPLPIERVMCFSEDVLFLSYYQICNRSSRRCLCRLGRCGIRPALGARYPCALHIPTVHRYFQSKCDGRLIIWFPLSSQHFSVFITTKYLHYRPNPFTALINQLFSCIVQAFINYCPLFLVGFLRSGYKI